jgi:hypothetical protein
MHRNKIFQPIEIYIKTGHTIFMKYTCVIGSGFSTEIYEWVWF